MTMKKRIKKISVAVVGSAVLLVGIIAIPYPGPGWLIVFSGLAILATEFEWAQRILDKARGYYDAWQEWLRRQPLIIKLAILAATGLVVVTTIWLLNGFGILNNILNLPFDWVQSPLFK